MKFVKFLIVGIVMALNMKRKLLFTGVTIIIGIMSLVNLNLIASSNDKGISGFELSELFQLAIAQTEAVQFCTKDYQPLDGICQYVGYIAPGVERYDCYEIEPDCALCDCDGTWIMEL